MSESAAAEAPREPVRVGAFRRTSKPDIWERLARSFIVLVIALGIADELHTEDRPVAALLAKYGRPPSQFMKLPSGARVHYRDQGRREGIPLMLLHGSNSSLHTWEPWVQRLGADFRVITFDFPGHGLTGPAPNERYSPDDFVKVVDEVRRRLGLARFSLAGNSMGGNVAWRYAIAHPDAVQRLVLVDASGLNDLLPASERPEPPIGFKIARTPGLSLLMEWTTPRRAVEKTTRAVFADQRLVNDAMIDRYYELLLYPGNRHATRLRASQPADPALIGKLGTIKAPTLILSGQKDTLAPVQTARMFHSRIPGSQLIEYPNVGHLPMEEIPDRSARDAREFLASTF